MNAANETNQIDRRFRRRHSVRRRDDFARIFAHKCSAGSARLVVYVAPNGLQWCRLGLSVGKRVGNAVRRNRVRRRIRESFRVLKAEIPLGFDVVVVARTGADELHSELPDLLRRLIIKAVRPRTGKATGSTPRPSCPEPPG